MSLTESLVAGVVLLIGLFGIAGLQVVAIATNFEGRSIAQASAISTSFASNISRWDYTDPRLNSAATVTSFTDPAITSKYDMGRGATASYQAQYSDVAADPNAVNAGALSASFPGLATDVDRDGKTDFRRYWNVFEVDQGSTGTPGGKLVQVIVRWKEPNYGYRQVTSTAFKVNPNAALQ